MAATQIGVLCVASALGYPSTRRTVTEMKINIQSEAESGDLTTFTNQPATRTS